MDEASKPAHVLLRAWDFIFFGLQVFVNRFKLPQRRRSIMHDSSSLDRIGDKLNQPLSYGWKDSHRDIGESARTG